MQWNRTPFQEAVRWYQSAVVSLFVNKYGMDITQYDQVTKVDSNEVTYIIIVHRAKAVYFIIN